MSTRQLLLAVALSAASAVVGFAQDSADVIVYGSTPGGFCAAIAAAREGASVILLEPTDHIGGLSTGGLSHCDSNQMVRETLMGLFDELHRRVVKDYTDRGVWSKPYSSTRKTKRQPMHAHILILLQMVDRFRSGGGAMAGRKGRGGKEPGPMAYPKLRLANREPSVVRYVGSFAFHLDQKAEDLQ